MISLRFRRARSLVGADGSPRRSISRLANLEAAAAAFLPDILWAGCAFLSACSTSRRIASDLVGVSGCFRLHLSTDALNSGLIRIAVTGSIPVAGRPLFFVLRLFLVSFIFSYYSKSPWNTSGDGNPFNQRYCIQFVSHTKTQLRHCSVPIGSAPQFRSAVAQSRSQLVSRRLSAPLEP